MSGRAFPLAPQSTSSLSGRYPVYKGDQATMRTSAAPGLTSEQPIRSIRMSVGAPGATTLQENAP